jgi:phenylalanyl-tRNA synthetase beta chain
MHTDASHRFERGADPEIQARAVSRAAALIAEIGGGTVDPETIDAVAPSHEERHRRPTVAVDLDRLDAFAGAPMPEGKPAEWLAGLGFEVEVTSDRTLAATVPSWRLSDVSETADLYEEVMRIHGFDAIPSTLPDLGVPDGPPTGRQLLRRRVRRVLSAAGYVEAIQWAFLSREAAASVAPLGAYDGRSADEETDVVLDNPLSELYSTLRRSLLPGLLEAARFNTRRNASSVRLFELGVVFGRSGSGEGPVGVVEREALGVLCGGAVGTPWEGRRELDLFDLKGALEAVAEAAGKRLEARPGRIHGLLPGTAAELYIEGVDGRRVGVLGRLAEDDEHYPLYAAEIELAALESTSEELYAALAVDSPPRLPGIQVDHTLTHPVAVAWADLESAIRESAAEELRRFRLENRYEGKGVPEGAVNTTVRFLYHGGERQLTQDEVNRHQEALVAVLEERFGWKAGQEDS